MAKIQRCANGHYYDAQKSEKCPYCENSENQRNIWINPSGFKAYGDLDDSPTVPLTHNKVDNSTVYIQQDKTKVQGISADDDQKTVALFKKHLGTGYVTGWLVCVKGSVKGRDYRIMHGMNWVGCSRNMDIWIDGDNGISAVKHCAIVYDGKSNRFFIVRGNGTQTYVNGTMLDESSVLKLGDRIQLGKCVFEFVPFCREGNVWNLED